MNGLPPRQADPSGSLPGSVADVGPWAVASPPIARSVGQAAVLPHGSASGSPGGQAGGPPAGLSSGLPTGQVLGQAVGRAGGLSVDLAAGRGGGVAAEPRSGGLRARTVVPVVPAQPEGGPPAAVTARRPRVTRELVLPLVVAELVLVMVLVVLDRSWPTVAVVAACGVLLGAVVALRVRGRLVCQWIMLGCRFLLRERGTDLPAEDQGAALLALVRPHAHCTHTMIGDAQAFLVSDVAGVGAVLRPEPGRREPGPPLLTPRDLLPESSDEQAVAYAVQVVHHAGVDRSQPPRVWLTLQALRTAEIHADEDVCAALANVVRRVRRKLRRAGMPFRTLSDQETLGSYAALAHVNAGRGRVREDWWHWQSGPIRHATFRLDGWPALSRQAGARLVRWLLAAAPDTAVTVSRTAHHNPTAPGAEPVVSAVLRIATSRPEALTAAVIDMERLANEVGVTLNRLDGQHIHGLAATLPVGIVEPS